MPATVNGGGDQLARGAVSARFRASDTVSQARWDAIFGENSGPKKNYSDDSNSSSTQTGNVSVKPAKARSRKS
jgi:hypothetical protein